MSEKKVKKDFCEMHPRSDGVNSNYARDMRKYEGLDNFQRASLTPNSSRIIIINLITSLFSYNKDTVAAEKFFKKIISCGRKLFPVFLLCPSSPVAEYASLRTTENGQNLHKRLIIS